MENAHIQDVLQKQWVTYHSIPTVGCSTGASAYDFVYAFLMDGCIAFCKKATLENFTLLCHIVVTFQL